MTPTPDQAWHRIPVEGVARHLDTDIEHGLSHTEAATRLEQQGPNALSEGRRRTPLRIMLAQFSDLMILVLLATAVVSGFVGEPQDTVAILVIVTLNALIGFAQEFRTERAVAALHKMSSPSIRVRRGGHIASLPSHEIVPGDVVFLEAGNIVPADLRLTESAHLRIAEAALSGESLPVEKSIHALPRPDLPLGDRNNMAYKGTTVTYGRGSGIVVATGMKTELGKIAALLAGTEEGKTPLQNRLADFGGRLAFAVLGICAVVFVAGLLRGESPVLMLMTAVSLAAAAIPEALPAVVAISLALGAYRMVEQKALVRRLPAVEALGSITVICSDKTGTLTQNRMRAEAFFADGGTQPDPAQPVWQKLFAAMALNCDATAEDAVQASGDPTEIALLEAARTHGADRKLLEPAQPRIAEIPFDAERKRMTTLHRRGNDYVAYMKGAPEQVLACCGTQGFRHGEEALDTAIWQQQADAMAQSGLRVLAVAMRTLPAPPNRLEDEEHEFALLGLVGLLDPPRAQAHHAVQECKAAGIIPVMITGDHPATALAIARRLGIVEDGTSQVLTGSQLSAMPDAELRQHVETVRIYARVDPAQKIRIVDALQANGELVAMTGDGVNDAPALKSADIGVAMGKGGTDVAREAAHMILLDDNFATIVHAVREGRRIYDNIRKFVKYGMTTNAGEIWTILLAPLLGMPIPLLPIHILWINLVTDGLPGIALAVEPVEPDAMRRPPRPPEESLFARGMWQHIVWVGLLMGGIALSTQAWGMAHSGTHWQSLVFTVLTLSQLAHVLAVRSERLSVFSLGLFSNRPLAWVLGGTLLLQMATLYLPAFRAVFHTQPLTMLELLGCVGLASGVFWAVETEKWLMRRGKLYA